MSDTEHMQRILATLKQHDEMLAHINVTLAEIRKGVRTRSGLWGVLGGIIATIGLILLTAN